MLYLVPTPIGNLEDITLRALRILREVDLIACEDTRTSGILLRKYNIKTQTTAFHLYNENEKLNYLLSLLQAGKNIAVISDAGTPGISDPGWILLKRAQELNIKCDVLPGASAVLPGILLSGLDANKFIFLGFPPEKSSERIKLLNEIKNLNMSICFYISPHKLLKNLNDFLEILGDRNCSLIREISKIHQEAINNNISGLIKKFQNENIKGELVLVIEGCKQDINLLNDSWHDEAEKLLNSGKSVKDISNIIHEKYNMNKNAIKSYLNQILRKEFKFMP